MKFYDQVYASLYQREADQQQMITLFSLLAIVISLVGVFGLIIFEAEHRRKEIGVRKVYGATTRQILWMFGRSYLVLSLVSSVIASPRGVVWRDAVAGAVQPARAAQPLGVCGGVRRHLPHHRSDYHRAELPRGDRQSGGQPEDGVNPGFTTDYTDL